MDTDELLRRVEERLNHTSNPTLPPEETMKAILSLGDEREKWAREYEKEYQEKIKTEKLLEAKERELSESRISWEGERKKLNDIAFIASEYEECLRRIAHHECNGKEVITALRVYNLNHGASDRKQINCRNYTTLDEAKLAYREYCKEMGFTEDPVKMLQWLYQTAR